MATGLLTVLSGAKITHGYKSNPLSFFFTRAIEFNTTSGLHETDRNALLLSPYYTEKALKPKLYPTKEDDQTCEKYKDHDYVCMAPTSVWFTKQWPKENWIKLIQELSTKQQVFIYLLGAPNDRQACEDIRQGAKIENVINLSGKLSFMESASLMRDAKMNYTNDSAPLHIASSMNAPVTAIYCSTLPSFGFGPLSDKSVIVEYKEELNCRPCGLHGKDHCPEGHFKCSKTLEQVLN
jgi:heptosyltransferase-2